MLVRGALSDPPGSRCWPPVSGRGVPGEQRDQNLGVGAAPSGDGIPAWCRPVAVDHVGREADGVVSERDIVEGLVVMRASRDLVDGRIDESQMAPGVLVCQ